jgi:hypothetical protein
MQRYLFLAILIVVLPFALWLAHEPIMPGTQAFPPFDLAALSVPGDTLGSMALN